MSEAQADTLAGKSSQALWKWSLVLAGGCFIFGAGVTVVDVALRAAFGTNVPGAIELTSLSVGCGAILTMPVCYALRSHVSAKLLSEVAPNRFGAPLARLNALVSVGFAALLFWIMAENAWSKLGSPQTTPDLGVPMPAALMLIAGVLGLAVLAAIYGLWMAWRRGEYL